MDRELNAFACSASFDQPLPERPRIAVVGAGAVGAYYGGRLAQHGHEVHFLLRGDFRAVEENGWTIRSCDGDFVLPPQSLNLYDKPEKMPRVDLVLVTLKTTSNDSYQDLIGPLVRDQTAILTIQNGLGNEDRLAGLFGAARILGGMAFVCINRVGPGVIHHMEHGLVRLGEFAARGSAAGRSPRAESIAALFRGAEIRCQAIDDLRRGRWEKLIWNVPFNGLGAVLDWTTDRLIATERGRAMVERLMREVIAAARADGVDFGVPEPGSSAESSHLTGTNNPSSEIIRQQIEHTRTMGAYLSSMQIDRRQGRPMEVESILGEPLRRAQSAGLRTPLLAALYELAALVGSARLTENEMNATALT